MEHAFDIDVAKEYGIPAAVILRHLYYWIEKNKANGKNMRDGRYWTYNSINAFCKLFPYLSKNTIIRAIKKLSDNGIIIEAVFNDMAFDRTKWYAITDKGYSIITGGFAQNDIRHLPNLSNSDLPKVGEPIPYEYQMNNHINNNISISNDIDCPSDSDGHTGSKDIEDVICAWNELSEYGITPIKKISRGSKRYKCLKARLREYGKEDVMTAIHNIAESGFLQGNNYRAWAITFDWFVCPSNFPKVLEGNYVKRDDKNTAKSNSKPDYGDWQTI